MAISIDATASGNSNSGTSLSYSHTCTGSNLYLIVFFWTNQSVSSVTYNGVSMTSLGSASASNGRTPYMYGLANPSTGANNVSITIGTSGLIYAASASYTGASSTQPNASSSGNVTNLGSISGTVSVTANNAWLVMGVNSGTDDALGSGSAGSGTTLRQSTPSNGTLYDSNGTVGTGSQSLNVTMTGGNTDDMGQVIVALSPFVEQSGGLYHISV